MQTITGGYGPTHRNLFVTLAEYLGGHRRTKIVNNICGEESFIKAHALTIMSLHSTSAICRLSASATSVHLILYLTSCRCCCIILGNIRRRRRCQYVCYRRRVFVGFFSDTISASFAFSDNFRNGILSNLSKEQNKISGNSGHLILIWHLPNYAVMRKVSYLKQYFI